jgi:MFS family permease
MNSKISSNIKPKLLKSAVLSLSILTVLSGMAVSPALGQIRLAFPDGSDLLIQMILTLPALVIIPTGLFSGWLSGRVHKRTIVLIGMIIYLLAGAGGGLTNTLFMLLVTRAFLGIGTGLIAPLSLSLIADFYSGEELATTMGQSSAVATLGGIFLPLISGWLSLYNWRYAFGAYLVAILVFLLVWFYLPEPPASEKTTGRGGKLPVGVYVLGIFTFLLMVVFYLLPTKIALFMMESGTGNAGQSGLVIAALNLAAFLIGMFFGRFRGLLKRFTPLFGVVMLTAGLLLIYFSQSIGVIAIGMFLCGLAVGSLMPLLFLTTANMVPDALNAPALAITNSSLYLGQFASPLIFSLIAIIFQGQGIRFNFLAGSVMAGISSIVILAIVVVKK